MDFRHRHTYPDDNVSGHINSFRFHIENKSFISYPRILRAGMYDNILSSPVLPAYTARTIWHYQYLADHHVSNSIQLYSLPCTDQSEISQFCIVR